MAKKKVLIASVLKPVNEPRMYKKLGLSLAQNSNVEVHIVGYKPKTNALNENIIFHPIFDFNRLSLARFNASRKFKSLLHELKPEIVIVNTFELLKPAVEFKQFYPCELIYDIRENHSLNVRELGIYPFPLNYILSKFIRNTERKSAPFINQFFLAEKCYVDELDFIGNNYAILENKYQGELIRRKAKESDLIQFAFTGTAHDSTGVFRAIDFVKAIIDSGQKAELKLAVHAAQEKVYSRLNSISYPWLFSKIQKQPIDNLDIIELYKSCDILLAPYVISKQNRRKFPTKLYDALANGIPIIISENQYWIENTNSNSAVLHYDFNEALNESTIKKIHSLRKVEYKDESALWETEKHKLKLINQFLD